MNKLWSYRFEIGIYIMGTILFIQFIFPRFINEGLNILLLILFLISIISFKLVTIHEHIVNKTKRGETL